MRKSKAQILLIGLEPDCFSLLEEAFQEADERSYELGWAPQTELVVASDVGEGIDFLRAARFDVILYDLGEHKADPLGACLQLRAEAPQVPVVVLAGKEDESLAVTLVRHGAQDYLIRSEIDCVPLVRAVRCAIERTQLQEAHGAAMHVDDLTGLYNQRGFQPIANRYALLAAHHSLRLLSVEIELVGNPSLDTDMRNLELAEILRGVFGPADVLARVGTERFACLSLVASEAESEAILSRLRSSLPGGAILRDVNSCVLCDNKAV